MRPVERFKSWVTKWFGPPVVSDPTIELTPPAGVPRHRLRTISGSELRAEAEAERRLEEGNRLAGKGKHLLAAEEFLAFTEMSLQSKQHKNALAGLHFVMSALKLSEPTQAPSEEEALPAPDALEQSHDLLRRAVTAAKRTRFPANERERKQALLRFFTGELVRARDKLAGKRVNRAN